MESHAAHAQATPLNRLAASATTHCLTGCAIGELMGMSIAMALGWSDIASIGLASGLAYAFGFSLSLDAPGLNDAAAAVLDGFLHVDLESSTHPRAAGQRLGPKIGQ
jgi:hypothetical protein